MSDIPELAPIQSTRSISERIRERVIDLIQKGVFGPGHKLPPEISLAQQLGVSRTSLREALQRLELEGYLARTRGVGTFVIGPKPTVMDAGIERLNSVTQIIASRGFTPGTAECEVHMESSEPSYAGRLKLQVGDPVTVVSRVRTADGRPFCLDRSMFPSRFLPATTSPASLGESLFAYVESVLGMRISHAIAHLIPSQADAFLSGKLAVCEGSLVLLLEQVHFLSDNTPVWYSQIYFPRESITWHVVRTA